MGHLGGNVLRRRDKRIDQVSRAAKLPDTDFVSSCFMLFDSTDLAINETLEALRDDKVYIFGLYGMGGSGKTTLAIEVGKRAKELNVFDRVVFSSVTRIANEKKIQDEIAEGLGLTLREETLDARQRQISERLRSEHRILIILDDIWTRLDLALIGIPYDHIGCKVLVTARSQPVCYLMGCQGSFNLHLFSDEEVWSLFRKCSGMDDGSSFGLDYLSWQLTKQCRGLPLAIVLAGAFLRGKTVDNWEATLETLQKGPDPEYCSSNSAISISQLSYDGLNSKVAKSLFLICGLFPDGHAISIDDLSQTVIRLGLCGKNEVIAAIRSLIQSALLMHAYTSRERVIMHSLVREAAIRITLKENPANRDSITEYLKELWKDGTSQYFNEDFQWYEELHRLLIQLYQVRGSPGGDPDLQVVVRPNTLLSATITKPSGKLVDFHGLCKVDKSFLPLLKEACKRKPQLIECQRRHSDMLRQYAFDSLGRVLFLLQNVRNRDWVYHKDELQIYWEKIQGLKFDLQWLSPVVEGLFSSTDIARIEELNEEEKCRNAEAAALREQLGLLEDQAALDKTERARLESKLDGFAITDVSNARIVSKVTPWWKFFFQKIR